jgi:hypothetical protein
MGASGACAHCPTLSRCTGIPDRNALPPLFQKLDFIENFPPQSRMLRRAPIKARHVASPDAQRIGGKPNGIARRQQPTCRHASGRARAVHYSKPWKNHEEQLRQLVDRGMAITRHDLALHYLKHIGYYRLSGYWFAFRERSGPVVLLNADGRKPARLKPETVALDQFRPGSTFQNAVDLYVFDKQLRLLTLDALERISTPIFSTKSSVASSTRTAA